MFKIVVLIVANDEAKNEKPIAISNKLYAQAEAAEQKDDFDTSR